MKKLCYLLFAAILITSACDNGETDPDDSIDIVAGCTDPKASNYNSAANDDDCNCDYAGFSAIGAAPVSAQRNVLLEEFTGEWCGWCVDGTVIIEDLIETYPGRIFASAIHQGDFLETSLTRPLMTLFNGNFFPSGVVDRKDGAVGRNLWIPRANQGLSLPAAAHLAIETKLNGDLLEGVVHVDFKDDLSANLYRVLIYVTESGIPAVSQNNYYNNLGGSENHPYYDKPTVLSGSEYIHNYVLREEVGNLVIADKATRGEGTFTRKFEVDLSSYQKENVEVLAIITNSFLTTAVNVNGVAAGETADWQ